MWRVWQNGVLAGLFFTTALGGCSGPIETYRSLSGVNKNDPDPQTAPFTHNLAEGEAAPYPNLGSFPPLPTPATNAAERQKLTQSLIAERTAVAAQSGPPPLHQTARQKASIGLPSAPGDVRSSDSTIAASSGVPPSTTMAHNSAPSGRRLPGEPPGLNCAPSS